MPSSGVADAAHRSTRTLGDRVAPSTSTQSDLMPRLVQVALGLLALDFALALVKFAMYRAAHGKPTSVLAMLVAGFILFLWVLGLARRLNWLRWMTIIGALAGVLFVPRAFASLNDSRQIGIQIVSYALVDAAAVLLCLKPARLWFASRRSPNNALDQARGRQLS